MTNSKLLSSLCYFSVFFAPLLVPVVIYFITDDYEVRQHAKRSLISHVVPVALLVIGMILFSFSIFSLNNRIEEMFVTQSISFWGWLPLIFIGIYSVLFFIIVVWNVYQGVKVLK